MKTTLKQLATLSLIALILLIGNSQVKAGDTKASKFESIETLLLLEDWMTDETIWNTNSANMNEYIQETDADLLLENWMTNGDVWDLNNRIFEETESTLELEDWMINDKTWNRFEQIKDTGLMIEYWMINSKFWE